MLRTEPLLDRYLNIATHPLLWIFLGLTAVFYAVQWGGAKSSEAPTAPDERIRRLAERVGMNGLHPVLFLILLLTWGLVAATLFAGLYAILWQVVFHAPPADEASVWDWRFTLAQLVALTTVLGAVIALPITINRLVLTRRQTDTVEQGHITDRINKAVEGLGAEKTVDRIGRPITIWTGKPGTVTHQVEDPDKFTLPPRAIETRRYRDIIPLGEPDKNEYHDGLHVEVKTWPDEKTTIERQGIETTVGESEHLGKVGDWQVFTETQPNLEVRIGAIYALERIAQDSLRDHVQIMEILCAYIRENAKTNDLTPTEPPFESAAICVDLQAAIDVIGRRSEKQKSLETAQKHRLDLRGTDLNFANFARGDFRAAILANCKLEACNFRDSDLSGALLNGSILNFSEFFRCNLTGAKLDAARINRPIPQSGGWLSSINMGELKGVSFPSADFSALQHLGSTDEMNQMMGSEDTILSAVLRHKMPSKEVMRKNIYRGMADLSESDLQAFREIDVAGFKYWFPFDAKDMAFGPERRKFLQDMGLDSWPYIEE